MSTTVITTEVRRGVRQLCNGPSTLQGVVAMDPNISLYQQYKSRTGYVLSWLVSTALATNCPRSLLAPEQLRNHTIPTGNIVPIAKWIARSDSTCRVPRSVLNDLGQAIELRNHYSQTLRGDRALTALDRSHDHFLDTLRDLRTVLHAMNATTTFASSQEPGVSNPANATSTQLSALSLQETTSDDDADEDERQTFFSGVRKFDIQF